MGDTAVDWAEKGWNLVTGCSPVSAGCANCYAARQAATRLKHLPRYAGLASYSGGRGRWSGEVRVHRDLLTEPLFRRTPSTWFVAPRGDFFHENLPSDFLDEAFAVMNRSRNQIFIIPTKRVDRALAYLNDPGRKMAILMAAATRVLVDGEPCCESLDMPWPLPNVILLASIEDQATADYRVPRLLRCNVAWRGVSAEPLLGPVNLSPWIGAIPFPRNYKQGPGQPVFTCSEDDIEMTICPVTLDWVIVGGESGPKARPCDFYSIAEIVKQCRDAGVPCFVKQLGADPGYRGAGGPGTHSPIRVHLEDPKGGDPTEWPPELRVREYPDLFGRESV